MMKKMVTFDAVPSITPDFAAKLANCASAYSATVHLECEKTRLCVDSLIGILALALRRILTEHGMTQEALAAAVGRARSRSHRSNHRDLPRGWWRLRRFCAGCARYRIWRLRSGGYRG